MKYGHLLAASTLILCKTKVPIVIYLLCEFNKSLKKFVIDFLLDKYPAGGEAYLSLVGKRRADHCRQTLFQVRVFEHNASILTSQLQLKP